MLHNSSLTHVHSCVAISILMASYDLRKYFTETLNHFFQNDLDLVKEGLARKSLLKEILMLTHHHLRPALHSAHGLWNPYRCWKFRDNSEIEVASGHYQGSKILLCISSKRFDIGNFSLNWRKGQGKAPISRNQEI
jgi:hypothetical protein